MLKLKLVFLSVALLSCSGIANAGPLNLNDTFPDIATDFVGASYAAGQLTVFGLSVNLQTNPTTTFAILNSGPFLGSATVGADTLEFNFEIEASIDSNGNIVAGTNTLTMTGEITALGDGTPLLTGNLLEFGASPGLDEFVFSTSGGSLASLYGGASGGMIGVIFANDALTGSFATDFSTGFTNGGFADVGVQASVPEPASLLLLISGGGLLRLWRKRPGIVK